jgi:Gas vesicle synthesis protein GvpL/GvpF
VAAVAAESSCVWLYAVAAKDAGTGTGVMTGVGGEPVRAVRTGGLTAFVGDVDQRDFGAAALRRNLEDLDWLDRTARAHHAVIEAIAERCPVVPMQLATVYASDHSMTETLRERATDLRRVLSRIRARSEWGVKAFAAGPADPGTGPGDPAGERIPAASGPGAAYLQRRRAHLMAQERGRNGVMADALAVHAALSRLCVSARLYPPQSPDLAGARARMVLNAAYLVADERAGEFATTIADLTTGHRSVRLVVTGPWPAYSFVGEGHAEGQR